MSHEKKIEDILSHVLLTDEVPSEELSRRIVDNLSDKQKAKLAYYLLDTMKKNRTPVAPYKAISAVINLCSGWEDSEEDDTHLKSE